MTIKSSIILATIVTTAVLVVTVTIILFFSITLTVEMILAMAMATYLLQLFMFWFMEMAIDTIFMCSLVDLDRNDGSADKPYFMTDDMRTFILDH